MVELHIEVLCLIVRILFCHPDTMLDSDIPDGILATKGAAHKFVHTHFNTFGLSFASYRSPMVIVCPDFWGGR
ncbi:MAG: hypothetical protein PVI66_16075 [Candidatus Aminicenantes bacterium]